MVREKIVRKPEYRVVEYSEEHWSLLRKLREDALRIMRILANRGIEAYVHGSVARGDVKKSSDVDVVTLYTVPSYVIEHILEEHNIRIYAKYIVIATPTSTPKAVVALDDEERVTISFPLKPYKPREYEFYKFSGLASVEDIVKDRRVPGVNKKLLFIEPTERGHVEFSIIGYENIVASKLGISIETVYERLKVLSRRDEIGRTGIFVKYSLTPDEDFEEALVKVVNKFRFLNLDY